MKASDIKLDHRPGLSPYWRLPKAERDYLDGFFIRTTKPVNDFTLAELLELLVCMHNLEAKYHPEKNEHH